MDLWLDTVSFLFWGIVTSKFHNLIANGIRKAHTYYRASNKTEVHRTDIPDRIAKRILLCEPPTYLLSVARRWRRRNKSRPCSEREAARCIQDIQ